MLIHVLQRFSKEAVVLRGRFLRSRDLERSRELEGDFAVLVREMCTIRLLDAWSRFNREVVVYSASGNATTTSGKSLNAVAGVGRISDVIPCLLSKYPKRKMEPDWYHSSQCLDAAKRLGIQNLSNLQLALGSSTSPVDEIRKVRNYFAHRSQHSMREYRTTKAWSRSFALPREAIVQNIGAGRTEFELWIDDVLDVARNACS
jgi:hypothetical protein